MTIFQLFICLIPLSSAFSSWGPSLLKSSSLSLYLSMASRNTGNLFSTLQEKLHGRKVFLVGLMGSGKSTLGSKLAKLISCQHFDTDSMIEERTKMPISTYFEQYGETKFRSLETCTLEQICQSNKSVIVSTGGGIVLNDENWKFLKSGIVVFLDPSISTIVQRLTFNPVQINSRPLLRDTENFHFRLEQMRNDRMEKYLRSDIHIPILGTDSAQVVVMGIAKRLLDFIDARNS